MQIMCDLLYEVTVKRTGRVVGTRLCYADALFLMQPGYVIQIMVESLRAYLQRREECHNIVSK